MLDKKIRTRHNSQISTLHTTKLPTQITLANPKTSSHKAFRGHLSFPTRNIAPCRTTTRMERARAILQTALAGILYKSKAPRWWTMDKLKWTTKYSEVINALEIVPVIQDSIKSRLKLMWTWVEKRMLQRFRRRHQETSMTWISRKILIASGRWLYRTLTNRQYLMRTNSIANYSSTLGHHSTKEAV